jgi:hypothetical protein
MRFACGLAVALGLSFTTGTVYSQEATSPVSTTKQTPASPKSTLDVASEEKAMRAEHSPAGQAPAEQTPAEPVPAVQAPINQPSNASTPPPPVSTGATSAVDTDSRVLSANQKAAQGDAAGETKAKAKENEKDTKELTASPSKIPAAPARKRRKRTVVLRKDPRKVVVPEGGAREPPAQIAPGLAPEEAARERRDAEQWLTSADGQLKMLSGRTLGAQQEETVGQVRNYMVGARSALKEGDMRRANTLALKAHLLSEDLVKH